MRNLSPQRSPNQDTLPEQAKVSYQNGDYEEALKLYGAALSKMARGSSKDERQLMLSNIVACRLNIGGPAQAEAAVENAKQCVALNDRWAKGHIRLAEAYIALGAGHSNDACNALQRAIQLDPRHPTARQMLIRELRRDHRSAASSQGERERTSEESNTVAPSVADAPTGMDRSSNSNNSVPPSPPAAARVFGVDDPPPQSEADSWSFSSFFGYLEMQFTETIRWYNAQSEDKRTMIHVVLLLVFLYVAFGGRFGFEQGHRRGNYEMGIAYDQFYGRSSSSSSQPPRHTNYHSNNYKPQYSSYQHHQSHSGRHSSTSGSFLDQWNGHLSPILLVSMGAAYLCHRNGIPISEAVSFLVWNVLFRRRRRYRRGWGGMGGGMFRPAYPVRRY